MHSKVMGADEDAEFVTTDAEDARSQNEVLREVLLIYPQGMTLDELICLLNVRSTEFSEIADEMPEPSEEALAALDPEGNGI